MLLLRALMCAENRIENAGASELASAIKGNSSLTMVALDCERKRRHRPAKLTHVTLFS